MKNTRLELNYLCWPWKPIWTSLAITVLHHLVFMFVCCAPLSPLPAKYNMPWLMMITTLPCISQHGYYAAVLIGCNMGSVPYGLLTQKRKCVGKKLNSCERSPGQEYLVYFNF